MSLLDLSFGAFLIVVGAYGLYMAQVVNASDDRFDGTRTIERVREVG